MSKAMKSGSVLFEIWFGLCRHLPSIYSISCASTCILLLNMSLRIKCMLRTWPLCLRLPFCAPRMEVTVMLYSASSALLRRKCLQLNSNPLPQCRTLVKPQSSSPVLSSSTTGSFLDRKSKRMLRMTYSRMQSTRNPRHLIKNRISAKPGQPRLQVETRSYQQILMTSRPRLKTMQPFATPCRTVTGTSPSPFS